MEAKDIAWNLFCQKGHISDYLFYSSLSHTDKEDTNGTNQDNWIGDSTHEHTGI